MKLGKFIRRTCFYGYLAVTCPKHCSVPIQPYTDRIVPKAVLKGAPAKDILVLDGFSENHVDIDIDLRSDISHGYLTSKLIEDGLPNANVHKKNIVFSILGDGAKYVQDSIKEPLLKEMREGKKYDAINISMGKEMTFKDISEMVGEEVTAKNIAKKRRKVKDFLIKNPDYTVGTDYFIFKTKAKEVMELVNCMDSLSSKGTKIYVSAGNGGKEKFNLLSLIDSCITVGALDKNGKKTYYSGDHSLIKRWAKGTIPLKKTDYGYQIKFDKTVKDIEEKNTTGFWHTTFGDLKGTSFSCPRAIVEDFKDK